MTSHTSVQKCFEDAEDSGVLTVVHKGLKQFPICVDDYDLVDVLSVDISKNRLPELPEEILSFVMMERLNCSNNYIKSLPDLSHLSALSSIDVSQNQLQSLPVHLCTLPLKILKASHNRLSVIPSEVGLLSELQALDLSCNELVNLPSTMGELASLRVLNIRRNQLLSLPDELSKLKHLSKLDFSCNKIASIPPAFRLISSLIQLDLTNNPLSSPPAQICLKGRLHIIKYLSVAAQQQEKRWSMNNDNRIHRSSSSLSSNSGNEKYNSMERQTDPGELMPQKPDLQRRNTLTNGDAEEIEIVDAVEQTLILSTTPTNESDKEKSLSLPVTSSPAGEKPSLARKPNFALSTHEQKEKQRILQEKGKLTPQSYKNRIPTPAKHSRKEQEASSTMSLDRSFKNTQSKNSEQDNIGYEQKTEEERLGDIAARKEQLLKNKEEIIKSKQRLELIKSKQMSRELVSPKPPVLSPNSTSSHTSSESEDQIFDGISKRNTFGKTRTSKKLKDGASNFTMRRFFDSAKEEFEQLEKLREAIESRLRIKLPDDLPASLSDGIVLCHLINQLKKGNISVIHVPSSGVPKLTMPKCQMNVDAFLDACRRAGVDKADICSAPDILEEKSPSNLCKTVAALLLVMGVVPPQVIMAKPSSPL